MSKALVLKNGVDFSANAVTTIEFADTPCTGITFAQNTYTVSGYDDVTVEYTVTPADTTDSVIWTSSNTDIVSISNGVMTVNGIGTCTITATCGAFTATATVTVNIACVPNWDFRTINASSGQFVSYGDLVYSRLASFGVGGQASEHYLPNSTANVTSSPYAIKIPNNTAKIRVSRGADKSASFYNGDYHWLAWLQDVASGNTAYPNSAKYVSSADFSPRTSESVEFTIPTDADCFVLQVRTSATYTAEDNANTVAESLGLTIEFIPAE